MRFMRLRLGAALIAIAGMLIGSVAVYLLDAQAASRSDLRQGFEHRATLSAELVAATIKIQAHNQGNIPALLGEKVSQLPARLGLVPRSVELAAVLDAHGRVLAFQPATAADQVRRLAQDAAVQRALRTGIALSNLSFAGPSRAPQLHFAAAFATPRGPRVFVDAFNAQITGVGSVFLASAPAVSGSQAYLIDGNERILAASYPPGPIGAPLPGRRLRAALSRQRAGEIGPLFFASSPVGAGTEWRILFVTPQSALYAPLGASRRSDWTIFAVMVAAVLALLAGVGLVMRKSRQVAEARAREHAAQRLAHERLHDALTGLPNRALFIDRTEHALARIARSGWPLAVLFIDLDQFKRINDSLGHAAGDTLLRTFADRLRGAIRPADTVSRFGGDEFLILCEDLVSQDDALEVAARVHRILSEPFDLGGRELHVTCSIGVALHGPGADVDAATLVRDADAAVYHAKANGRGGVKVFDDELHRSIVERLDAEMALRCAVAAGELQVQYQPIVALPDGELRGVEALARWRRPGIGPIAPTEFIALAEECGLIIEVGQLVLGTALREVQQWHELGLITDEFLLSVNVSPLQLACPEFLYSVSALIADWSLPAGSLCLEITESAVMADPELANRALTGLRQLGVKLAIDDFGVGQSSLEQLVNLLPVDILKLDRAFVTELQRPRDRAVVAAVAPMAAQLGMLAIAEGVETADQASRLAALGYPLAQGFHFGPPRMAGALQALLSTGGGVGSPV